VIQKSVIPAEIFGGPAGTFAEVAFGTNQNMGARATLSQLIFDGSYIVALQASKVYLQFYQNAKKKTDNEVRETIVNSYGNVLLANESIKILEKNKLVLEKNLNDADQIFKNGLGEQETAEQIALTLNTVKTSIDRIKRLKEIGSNMLKIQLGMKITDDFQLTDTLENLSVKNTVIAPETSTFSVATNIDYQIASSMVTQKKLFLKLEKAKALPSLVAVGNFGYNSFSQTFTFFNSDQRWFNYANVGVSLNIPIFSSFARRARTAQAKLELEKSETQLSDTAQMLELGYQKAKSDFEFSTAEFFNTKNNLALAERIERKQQIKFKEGLSTSF
jgi:outer membrane protein TolC